MADKIFKDPIYGYIEIDEEHINNIIDTANFQRLRDIIQTSYSPLYTSALHNRFTHSIGVYHLGKIALNSFRRSCLSDKNIPINKIEKYFNTFEIACLLHDIGHAPFSHTGEDFYFNEKMHDAFHEEIISLTKDDVLKTEITKNSYKAAPHELMSVIISLKNYGHKIPTETWSFFSRCITGYKYTEKPTKVNQLLNCMIELLNSTMIDVDKLDYLLRDAFMSGFDTTSIDYIRLLESIRIVKCNGVYKLCFYKTAVSVIENVVYARDAEKKWIQNHPTVIYDAYLLQNIMSQIINTYMSKNYIEYDYLTETGLDIKNLGKVRLLSDSDILYLMKNLPQNKIVLEYFDRRYRKHPIWKTEAEYKAIFIDNEKEAQIIEQEFNDLKKELSSLGYINIINNDALNAIKKDADKLAEDYKKENSIKLKMSITKRQHQIAIMEALYRFSKREDIDFNFTIISAKQFNSGFGKPEFYKINMIFPELSEACEFGSVSNVLKASESASENFFYLYYIRKNTNNKLHISELIEDLLKIANIIENEKQQKQIHEKIEQTTKRLK